MGTVVDREMPNHRCAIIEVSGEGCGSHHRNHDAIVETGAFVNIEFFAVMLSEIFHDVFTAGVSICRHNAPDGRSSGVLCVGVPVPRENPCNPHLPWFA
jgi:hypothetical protein